MSLVPIALSADKELNPTRTDLTVKFIFAYLSVVSHLLRRLVDHFNKNNIARMLITLKLYFLYPQLYL